MVVAGGGGVYGNFDIESSTEVVTWVESRSREIVWGYNPEVLEYYPGFKTWALVETRILSGNCAPYEFPYDS